ncbi:DUF2877 domain-containing protein [Trabulsiella odontotermitis]|uniref:DUF2877 domain-containing protein n=1 Tax=Trabulsiella odontotermitis TaxID=379893 RepID=A0A0L0GGV8_9ENTR|nr:DUF2877 domain-containing protein [Trabulsiella odontotermitis]KNC88237.1 hypothetical protein GM31_10970 [Trabulsiella odontotermitis]
MQALTADEAFLTQRISGRVEQVFSRAVNLFIPHTQQLLTLLSEGCDNAPNSCRLALTQCDTLFRPGEQVQFSNSGIAVGEDKWIDTSACQRWLAPKWALTAEQFQQIPWQRWSEVIHQQLRENKTLFLYRGDNVFYQEIARVLQKRRQALYQALLQNNNVENAVAQCIGLGIGLTPSADDYLVGLGIILFIRGHPAEKYREAFLSALHRARNNTTLLSAVTLDAAFQQRYRESLGRCIADIITEPNLVTLQNITDIKNIGSSSGCDMLYGMADACALSHRSGGNYVNQDSC